MKESRPWQAVSVLLFIALITVIVLNLDTCKQAESIQPFGLDFNALTESEQIIYKYKLEKTKLEEQKAELKIQIAEKQVALEEEEKANLKLYKSKVSFEQAYQKLFLENANKRVLEIRKAIKLMDKLNN